MSHDRKTMPHTFADFILTETSPGLLIVSQQTSILVAIEELLLIWTASEVENQQDLFHSALIAARTEALSLYRRQLSMTIEHRSVVSFSAIS